MEQFSKIEIEDIYDRICTALTAYESADSSDDYDPGAELYNEIVEVEEKLSALLN